MADPFVVHLGGGVYLDARGRLTSGKPEGALAFPAIEHGFGFKEFAEATKELAPTERLERYIDLFRDLGGKAERMCPGGSFASVFGAVSPPVQRALHAFTKMQLDWLEGIVREGAASGAFAIGEQAPRDVALQIFSSVQGALLTGRLTSDPGVLDAVATELRTYLRYTPEGRGGSQPA